MIKESTRYGRFFVSNEMFDSNKEVVCLILSNVAVTRCEYLSHKGEFEYIGWSSFFEEIKAGNSIPTYEMLIATDEYGKLYFNGAKRL